MGSARGEIVGVVSDTHGLVRAEAVEALRGARLIVHAGDVGGRGVIDAFAAVAPVTAVRGNNDVDAFGRALPPTATVDVGGARLYVVHDVHELDVDAASAGYAAVIAGHSHRPSIVERDGVLFVNPGSAGPRRFRLPVAVALLRVARGRVRAEIITLGA